MKRDERGITIKGICFASIISSQRSFKKVVLCFITTFIFITLMTSIGGCFAMMDDKDSISELSFSHDGKKVVFDRCKNESCQIQVYDLETGELAAYQSPKGERWTMGKYSYDGKRIAFSVIPFKSMKGLKTGEALSAVIKGKTIDLNEMQIAVMDADGKNFKKVTSGPGAKLYPAFSHNGKKILYARAAYIRESGRTPAGQYDAWEVNLGTGEQTQLTFFEYFYMGNLTYFPDDERFIYYGEMPNTFPGSRYGYGTDFNKNMIELANKGMEIHGLVVMKGQELIPNPYRFPPKTFPQKPLLSKDGSVLIYEKSHSGDFYLYSENGEHRYVGGCGSVNAATISADGQFLAMIATSLHIFTVQDGKRKVILYLPSTPKTITNWEEVYRKNKNLYKMMPERSSFILNK